MIKFSITRTFYLLLFSLFSSGLIAQSVVSGIVTDAETGETLIGASVLIKGTVKGTVTDIDGSYKINSSVQPPYTLQFSSIGYKQTEKEVTTTDARVDLAMTTQAIIGNEVVVSASRVEEKILESPVTIEKLDYLGIQQTSNADYFDEINTLKGVKAASGSMTFTSYNTRGFAAVANTRFVQLMDGMDNAAPLLNFPTGNVVGISELDIQNVELVPGAASALYGPNAFNGILLMNSKSPFDFPGLSAQLKGGFTYSTAAGRYDTGNDELQNDPFGSVSVRWAQKLNDKLAYKLNFSALQADDWVADDYSTDRPTDGVTPVGDPTFDGVNTYGDETSIFLPFSEPGLNASLTAGLAPLFAPAGLTPEQVSGLIATVSPIQFNRTGLKEQDLLESRDAMSLKASGALHYRISDKVEAIYNYRYGNGSTVYQGSERYALRNFVQQYNKLEFKGTNFFVRGYSSATDAGNSYNLTALGALANEGFSPTAARWVPTYAGTYLGGAIQAYLESVQAGNPIDLANLPAEMMTQLHGAARQAANAGIPQPGTEAFNNQIEAVRNGLFQRGGAGFIDNSKLYHAEGNYDFSQLLGDVIGLQVGGNFRQYNLFTDGTVFNEDPDGDGVNERIKINEYGAYFQVQKKFADDRLKTTVSLRYDKNENFDGNVTPRVSMVYSAGANREHNFRASFQTGFRNPSTQGQYIYFPTTNILLGTSKENAERYGLHSNGVWTETSYIQYIGALIAGTPADQAAALLVDMPLEYVKPERLMSIEAGYKGIIKGKLMTDLNVYYNIYNDFITQLNVVNKVETSHQGNPIPVGTTFRPYLNATEQLSSYGVGLGLTYSLTRDFKLTGNLSYQDYQLTNGDEDTFESGFNMPPIMFNIGIANRKIAKNLGFALNYKWQDGYYWENSFGNGELDAYGSLNGQVSYRISDLKSVIKIGASNLLGTEYRTNIGGPYVGRTVFLSLTYDEFGR